MIALAWIHQIGVPGYKIFFSSPLFKIASREGGGENVRAKWREDTRRAEKREVVTGGGGELLERTAIWWARKTNTKKEWPLETNTEKWRNGGDVEFQERSLRSSSSLLPRLLLHHLNHIHVYHPTPKRWRREVFVGVCVSVTKISQEPQNEF